MTKIHRSSDRVLVDVVIRSQVDEFRRLCFRMCHIRRWRDRRVPKRTAFSFAISNDLDGEGVPPVNLSARRWVLRCDVEQPWPRESTDRWPISIGVSESDAKLGRYVTADVEGEPDNIRHSDAIHQPLIHSNKLLAARYEHTPAPGPQRLHRWNLKQGCTVIKATQECEDHEMTFLRYWVRGNFRQAWLMTPLRRRFYYGGAAVYAAILITLLMVQASAWIAWGFVGFTVISDALIGYWLMGRDPNANDMDNEMPPVS